VSAYSRKHEKGGFFHGTKTETGYSDWRNHPLPPYGAETDAGPGGFQTAAYGSRHHPEHLLSDRRRYLQHPHLGPCWSVPDLSGGLYHLLSGCPSPRFRIILLPKSSRFLFVLTVAHILPGFARNW